MGYCYIQTLPRCGAYARSAGRPCRQPAMANGRCYIHGGKSPVKHGCSSYKSKAKRRKERQAISELREAQKSMKSMVCG